MVKAAVFSLSVLSFNIRYFVKYPWLFTFLMRWHANNRSDPSYSFWSNLTQLARVRTRVLGRAPLVWDWLLHQEWRRFPCYCWKVSHFLLSLFILHSSFGVFNFILGISDAWHWLRSMLMSSVMHACHGKFHHYLIFLIPFLYKFLQNQTESCVSVL